MSDMHNGFPKHHCRAFIIKFSHILTVTNGRISMPTLQWGHKVLKNIAKGSYLGVPNKCIYYGKHF
jgi:hypothetical protein